MTTNFATRYKKDLSTETLKAKLVRRKSILQKESRHKHFNKGRQFGLADVNTQHARAGELSRLEETEHVTNAKICGKERMEMLQRYKAEKELQKLKAQRQKPVFKCGRYQPEMPSFLPQPSQIPVLVKPKEKVVAEALPVRVTRSKARNILEEVTKPPARLQASTIVPKGSGLQPPQRRQQQIYVDKPAKKETRGAPSAIPPPANRRITRATTATLSKIPQVLKPAAAAGNPAQKTVNRQGKQQRDLKKEEALHETKEDVPMETPVEKPSFQLVSAEDTEEAEVFPEKENVPCIPALPPRRTRSFAPQNFVFKALEGLTSYKVTPMTPSRADMFLSPDLVWSPTKTSREEDEHTTPDAPQEMCEVPKEDSKDPTPQDGRSESGSPPAPEVIKENLPEGHSPAESQEEYMECTSDEMTAAVATEMEISQRPPDLPAPEALDVTGEPQHDVPYFRNVLRSETERLSSCCLEWDGAAEMDIPEDAKDLVRTTVGQTRLLIAERFKQFEGLVDNCEFRRGEKETTCSDLEGFWDMVAFQVEDVNKKFERLRKLQENGWQAAEDQRTKQIPKKKTACPRANRVTGKSAGRAAARKRLAAIKATMRSRTEHEGSATESAGPETLQEKGEKITFDGGFFHVESPAKLFLGQTPKRASRSSPRTSRQATPRSAGRALLRSCVDPCVARPGTPGAGRSCPNSPNPDAFPGLSQADFLDRLPDQSGARTAEGSGAAVGGEAEDAGEPQAAPLDSPPRSSEATSLGSVDSRGAESPDAGKNGSDIVEGVPQTPMELGEDEAMCSPEKDAQFEGASSLGGEQPTPKWQTGPLLGDSFCDSRTPEGKPPLDCSIFFTPLKNEAQKSTAAALDNDLIVFSPLPFPAGEK
ncbi:disks large-associated protein 5 isoform X2 [Paroedura picta]|uniref:disks large-associated protein 5 isoform X2 n=1 Tax=Paroedura picta TaxID=143630 RepID=UPI004055EE6E